LIKDSKGKPERRMFDWDAVYKGGEEWSFEEVKARQRGLLGREYRGDVKEWEMGWHLPGCESAGWLILTRALSLTNSIYTESSSTTEKDAFTNGQHQARQRGDYGYV
jgi:hypothetical protein